MTLTAEDRKRYLGFGGLAKVARTTRRTLGHVSQVNKFPQLRPDPKVMRAIARTILKRHPEVPADTIWPPLEKAS